jgi:hypothetical protein
MNGPSNGDTGVTVEALRAALQRSREGTYPAKRELGPALDELDEWLADDRQWRRGEPSHWKTLLDDVADRLQMIVTLSDAPQQEQLDECRRALLDMRRLFRRESEPDEALRRRLRHISRDVRGNLLEVRLLVSGWRRLASWSVDDPERADCGIGALRDLADLHGHDGSDLLKRAREILADSAWEIARVRGEMLPDRLNIPAGASAHDRLDLSEQLLQQPPRHSRGVVWLEYLQADLYSPPTLPLGPAVTLYQQDFLRSMIHEPHPDQRLPAEAQGDARLRLALWLGAHDPDEAQGDYEVHGDPRIYLRIELEEMPPTRLLSAARETAEFIVAFGSLGSNHHDIWVLSDSYYVADHAASTSAPMFNRERAEEQLPHDVTGFQLSQNAEALGRHLPLSSPELRIAGRLLVWLRQAEARDNPARLVLCDRVVEQVCGWAGVASPARFVTEFLKPNWIYEQIRHAVLKSYRELDAATRGQHGLTSLIETAAGQHPHTRAVFLPTVNLKAILEHLDELIEAAPDNSAAWMRLRALQQRTATPPAAKRWIDELAREFGNKNARLRRARNALMHGGPLVTSIVDEVAHFAVTLAYFALDPAVNFLLADEDVTDGFLDRQGLHLRCLDQLRAGTPASEALFWEH